MQSFLFLPSDRLERLDKAVASGAFGVILDLEDGVAPTAKPDARNAFVTLAENDYQGWRARLWLRLNAVTAEKDFANDLDMLAACPTPPRGLFLSKVENPEEITKLRTTFPQNIPVIAIIESARGMLVAAHIAASDRNLVALGFGSADYAKDIGSDMGWDALAYGRGCLLNAAACAGVGALDGAFLQTKDQDGLRQEALRVATMGFAGKIAIHPTQVPTINQAFAPNAQQIAWAQAVLAHAQNKGPGPFLHEGHMIDAPVLDRAQQMIDRAAQNGKNANQDRKGKES
ncbi:MAG: CoA ester lyase [Pseudomonadota bacterium]